MGNYKWVVKIEHTYESVDMCGDIQYHDRLSFIECSNEDEAYQKANEYYDKTKNLYRSPLRTRFGCKFAFGKKDIEIFDVKKEKLKNKVKYCRLYLHVIKINLTDIDDSLGWLTKNVVL